MGNSYISKPKIGVIGKNLAELVILAASILPNVGYSSETVKSTLNPKTNDTPAVETQKDPTTPKIDSGLVEKIKMLKDMMSINKTLTKEHYSADFTTKEGIEKSKKIFEATGKNTTYDVNGINLNGDSVKYTTPIVVTQVYEGGLFSIIHTAFKWNGKKGHIKYIITTDELPGESYEMHIDHEEKDDGSINDTTYSIIKDENGKEEKSKITTLNPDIKKDKNEKEPKNSIYAAIILKNKDNSVYLNLKNDLRSETNEPKPVASFPRNLITLVGGTTLTITAEGASIAHIGVDK